MARKIGSRLRLRLRLEGSHISHSPGENRLENPHSIHIPVRMQKWPPRLKFLQGHVTAKLLTRAWYHK